MSGESPSAPDTVGMLIDRGRVLIQARRFDDAWELLAPLTAEEPDNSTLWLLVALAHLGGNRPVEAHDAAGRALQLEPQSAQLHLLMARVLIVWGKFREGIGYAYNALRFEPDLVEAHLLVARSLVQVQQDLQRALWHAERARELEPDSARTHHVVGSALTAFKTRTSARWAREALEAALCLDPQDSDTWNDLGLADLRRRRSASAARAFVQALRLDPQSRTAAHNLPLAIWVLVLRGWTWMLGVFGATVVFTGLAVTLDAESFAIAAPVHVVGAALVGVASWWVVIRRPLRVFPVDMRMAAMRVLRRDRLVFPTWFGLAWAGIVQTCTVAVPWGLGHPTAVGIAVCTWLSVPGYTVGRLVSRYRLARMTKQLQARRSQQWHDVVVAPEAG